MKKLSSRPNSPKSINSRTKGAAPIPPDRGEGLDEIFPFEILRKSICAANAISLAMGDCDVCKTPNACKALTGNVVAFINDLHRQKTHNKKTGVSGLNGF